MDEIQLIYGSNNKKQDINESVISKKNVNQHKLPKLKIKNDHWYI